LRAVKCVYGANGNICIIKLRAPTRGGKGEEIARGYESRVNAVQCFARGVAPATRISYLRGDANGMPGRKRNSKGDYIGAYVSGKVKETLRDRAAAENRTLSQEITRILEEAVKGSRVSSALDRRAPDSGPRRRDSDPLPRRRKDDLPYVPSSASEEGEQIAAKVPGNARQYFGTWDSSDERSADNERIDLDLAREYDGPPQP
jgi:hypothetical protein